MRAPPPRAVSEPRYPRSRVSCPGQVSERTLSFSRGSAERCLPLQRRPRRTGHWPRLALIFQPTSSPISPFKKNFFFQCFKNSPASTPLSLLSELLTPRTSASDDRPDRLGESGRLVMLGWVGDACSRSLAVPRRPAFIQQIRRLLGGGSCHMFFSFVGSVPVLAAYSLGGYRLSCDFRDPVCP